ncbi:MAG: cytochrome c [Burkholderiales bacterium]|nr:cytochrome c [Burkholderiales bacterium]
MAVIGAAAVTLLLLAGIIISMKIDGPPTRADPDNLSQVSVGKRLYEIHCAACHGARLEGQPDWQKRLANGRMPAPPHDATGHTWHHTDSLLFNITKYGLLPGKYAPPDYRSDMPAFIGTLSDEEIWAALAYIKSFWPNEIRKTQRDLTLHKH